MASDRHILYGAGTIGRLIARQLLARGTPPLAFADNDAVKWGTRVEGILVDSPDGCRATWPDAHWVATVHRLPARTEILAGLASMDVPQVSLYEFLPARCDLPPAPALETIYSLLADIESMRELTDQIAFRTDPTTHRQRPPRDIANVYFEDFFTHLDSEVYYDLGGADGDTVIEFERHWDKYRQILVLEPDVTNYRKLQHNCNRPNITCRPFAVGDYPRSVGFSATGDQTAHIDETRFNLVQVVKIDELPSLPPTFIKMDIEGSELAGLWGARETIKRHSPVLAICAYHEGSHLWEIPLLIHALNPTYKIYLRRYLEATWEIIYYAVPLEREVK